MLAVAFWLEALHQTCWHGKFRPLLLLLLLLLIPEPLVELILVLSSHQRYNLCCAQVWGEVMQQVPIRAGLITQLSQAAEVTFLLLIYTNADRQHRLIVA